MIGMSRWTVGVVLGLAACAPVPAVEVNDGLEPGPGLSFGPRADVVHAPYLVGAKLHFRARNSTPRWNHSGWAAESTNTASFRIATQQAGTEQLAFDVEVLAPGEATLVVFSGGARDRPWREVKVRAEAADEIRLYPVGRLRTAARPEDVAALNGDVILGVSGQTTMMTRAFRTGTELFGAEALVASGDGTRVVVEQGSAYGGVLRDWLHFRASPTAETLSVPVAAGGTALRWPAVRIVESDAVVSTRMLQRSEDDLRDDQAGTVVVEGRTAANEPVFGLMCAFALGGEHVSGAGDVFAYTVKKATQKHLVATVGNVTGEIDIHAESGAVGSTGDKGCSQATGVTPLALFALFAALRRWRGAA